MPLRKWSSLCRTMSTTCLNSVAVRLATTSRTRRDFGNQQQAATAVGDTLYLVAILSMRDPA